MLVSDIDLIDFIINVADFALLRAETLRYDLDIRTVTTVKYSYDQIQICMSSETACNIILSINDIIRLADIKLYYQNYS